MCFCNITDEPLEITYSYWDGTGHRRVMQVSTVSMYCEVYTSQVSFKYIVML